MLSALYRRLEDARDQDRAQLVGAGPRPRPISLRLRRDQAEDRREKVSQSNASNVPWIYE